MTIWILALVLLAVVAAVGYNQGAIRMAFSFVGLLSGALLAMPLAHFVKPVFPLVGVEHPVLIWALSPLVVFVLFQILFKATGFFVHKKVDLYYKYKAGDLRLALWERLNGWLGLCLGLANGTIYLVLISLVIYPLSYLTAQTASGEGDPRTVSFLNKAGRDLQTVGMARAVAAIEPLPEAFYDAADIVGLLYQNRLLIPGRLPRYPLFLGYAERPEFREIATDKDYNEGLLRQSPVTEVIGNPRTLSLLKNKSLMEEIWNRTQPDLKDLSNYLATGKSPRYDSEKILGRWDCDVNSAIVALKRANPNLTSSYLRQLRQVYYPLLAKTTFMATPDNHVFLKKLVRLKSAASSPAAAATLPNTASNPARLPPPANSPAAAARRLLPGRPPAAPTETRLPPPARALHQTLQDQPATVSAETLDLEGSWKSADGNYELSFLQQGRALKMTATVVGERLVVIGEALPLIFRREE